MYVEYFKKFHDKNIDFCNMFRKLNTSTEHELEFFMLLKGNSFQNVTFFRKNPREVIQEEYFLSKSQRFAFSMPFNLTEIV